MATVSDLIDTVEDRVRGCKGASGGRRRILAEMNFANQDLQRRGDTGLPEGWPYFRARATFSVSPAADGLTLLTIPDFRQPIAFRQVTDLVPRVLAHQGVRRLAESVPDWSQTEGADIQNWAVAGYDRATQQLYVRFDPPITTAVSLDVLYEKRGETLVDSHLSADAIEVPPEFEEALVCGTEWRLYKDRTKRKIDAKAEFAVILADLKSGALRAEGPQRVQTLFSRRRNAGQRDIRERHRGRWRSTSWG